MTAVPNALANTDDFEFAALQVADNYRSALMQEFREALKGRVLEVGAGIGQMTKLLLAKSGVDTVVAVEPNAAFVKQFRAALPETSIIEGTAQNVGADREWNAILSVNVLEHIEADNEELATYCNLLSRRKGMLCLFVPARPEIYSPLDRDFGHYRRYQKPELKSKLEVAGFRVRSIHYYNLVGYFGWWWTFCVRKRRSFDVRTVRFFDRLIFPATHALEHRLVRPPVGQSLIAIAEAA